MKSFSRFLDFPWVGNDDALFAFCFFSDPALRIVNLSSLEV
jgi:hypothetical protein